MQKKIIYIIAGLILILALWFICAGQGDVSDIRERTDTTRNELRDAENKQQEEAETIAGASKAVRDSQSSIRKGQGTIKRIQDLERSDAELITESQSILRHIRERSEKENAN